MKPIDLKLVFSILVKRWWIIFVSLLLCTAAAVAASLYLIDPVYRADTTLYIIEGADAGKDDSLDYNDLLMGSQLVKDYRELVRSRLVAKQVIKDLELENLPVEAFSKKISVDLKNDTRVIQISVTDTDPIMAKTIADKVTEVFIEKVVDIMQVENVRVIDIAEVPEKPVKPDKMKNGAIAFVIGCVFGLGIIFIIEFFDNTVKTAEDIKEFIGLPVTGMIPAFSRKLTSNDIDLKRINLITHEYPKSPIAEAYRVLRTNIQFSSIDRPLKSLVVTSFGSSEGKTTTSVNLAAAFSQQGGKVLLIDGDLRKPKIHHVFGLENFNGLTNLLTNHDNYRKYIKTCWIENLHILVCGVIPPNPSELFSSNAMQKFMQQVCDDYEMILIDAPPVGLVTDAAVLSTIADGTILVAASGTVTIDALVKAKELLNKVNANILGVLLNKIDRNSSGSSYYQYYYEEERQSKKRRGKSKKSRHISQEIEGK